VKALRVAEEQMAKPGFWDNKEAAGKVLQDQKRARAVVEPIAGVEALLSDGDVLLELGQEDEEAVAKDLEDLLLGLERALGKVEFQVMLGGEHDHRNAYLNIQAGAGGIDAADWAEMLMRMYLKWAERMDLEVEKLDYNAGEEAGLRNVSRVVSGPYAYGHLKAEKGVHRLVRISPFDGNARRQTSFASVEVIPEFDDDVPIEVNPDEIKIDTYRAGGAGGQHVNKTESAVRITHLETGLVTSCQNERSQHKNKAFALKQLVAKLYQLREAQRQEELKQFYGDRGAIAWGNQIRSYVLQPYQMVKDLRTGVETSNVDEVLGGRIQEFIEAYLKGTRRKKGERKDKDKDKDKE
jgi:peptide chain release factor 2